MNTKTRNLKFGCGRKQKPSEMFQYLTFKSAFFVNLARMYEELGTSIQNMHDTPKNANKHAHKSIPVSVGIGHELWNGFGFPTITFLLVPI